MVGESVGLGGGMGGHGMGVCGNSVLSPQFFCECKTAQKTEIFLKGEKLLPLKVAVRSK